MNKITKITLAIMAGIDVTITIFTPNGLSNERKQITK